MCVTKYCFRTYTNSRNCREFNRLVLFLVVIHFYVGNASAATQQRYMELSDNRLKYGIGIFGLEKNTVNGARKLLQTARKNVGPISNLNNLLLGFKRANCLVVLNSFRKIDLPQFPIPLLTRKLRPIAKVREGNSLYGYVKDIVWAPEISNLNLNERCSHSKFYAADYDDSKSETYCATLLMHDWSLKTRPWNCDVDVNIFVPDYTSIKLKHPGTLEYTFRSPLVPKIGIFLDLSKLYRDDLYSEMCETTCFRYLRENEATHVSGLYIFGSLKQERHGNYMISNIKFSHDCVIFRKRNLAKWGSVYNTIKSRFRSNDYQTRWSIIAEDSKHTEDPFLRSLNACNNTYLKMKSIAKVTHQLTGNKIVHAQVYIFLSILGNYSVRVRGGHHCLVEPGRDLSLSWIFFGPQNDIGLKRHIGYSLPPAPLIVLNDSSSALRFITCGIRGSSAYPFVAFLEVFDNYIFLFI